MVHLVCPGCKVPDMVDCEGDMGTGCAGVGNTVIEGFDSCHRIGD